MKLRNWLTGLVAVAALAMVACTTTTTAPGASQVSAGICSGTFNSAANCGLIAADAMVQASTALFQAGKVNKADTVKFRTSLDLVVAGIKTAQATSLTNTDLATQLLVAALNQIAAMKAPAPPTSAASGAPA